MPDIPVSFRRSMSAGQLPSKLAADGAAVAGAATATCARAGAADFGAAVIAFGVEALSGSARREGSDDWLNDSMRNNVIVKPAYSSGASGRSRRPSTATW